MKTIIILATLVISQTIMAKTTKYECLDVAGYNHEVRIVQVVLKMDKVTLSLEGEHKVKFKEAKKKLVQNPLIYVDQHNNEVYAEGKFEKHEYEKTHGMGILKRVVHLRTIFVDANILKGEDGKIYYTHATSTRSVLGLTSSEDLKILQMDCIKIKD